jgi:hypothetical protein
MNRQILDFSDVILTGGTGRSGTTIIGKLLSRHSTIGLSKPSEIKMLTSGNGLLDLYLGRRVGRYKRLLVTDRLHLARFRYRLFNDWWERDSKSGGVAGLIQGIEFDTLEELFEDLRLNWKVDKKQATQSFFRSFIDNQKLVSGKNNWIDTTPVNLMRAGEISEFAPGVRFIHMVRDGRDVISSVIREPWGPSNYFEGLDWYRKRMRKILLNSNALGSLVLTISLEDLVINRRGETLEKIMAFLNLKDEGKLRDYFETELKAEKVTQGRWKNEVTDYEKFNRSYLEIVSELKSIDPTVPISI